MDAAKGYQSNASAIARATVGYCTNPPTEGWRTSPDTRWWLCPRGTGRDRSGGDPAMSLRMHPRENVVETARRDLEGLVIGWRKHHDLTDAEVVSVVSDVLSLQLQRWAKYRIREERHGDTDKPGGLE